MNFDQMSASLPKFFERLSEEDKMNYCKLKMAFAAPSCKNRRNKSTETFAEIITSLHTFIARGDKNDADRALVCGICWLNDAVAINTRQLRLLISKCKSSINGSLQQLGYGTVPSGSDSTSALIRYFPFMKENFNELRQWTIRQKIMPSAPTPSQIVQLLQQQNHGRYNLHQTSISAPVSAQASAMVSTNVSAAESAQTSAFISPAPEILPENPSISLNSFPVHSPLTYSSAPTTTSDFNNNDSNNATNKAEYAKVNIFDDPYSFTFPSEMQKDEEGSLQSDIDCDFFFDM